MQAVSGGCHCGNILVELELSRPANTYNPRACDCTFCRKHGAAYISDPQGRLDIRIKSEGDSRFYRQGSGTAECLLCGVCGVLVGALYRENNRIYAAINAQVVDAPTAFGAEQTASPKALAQPDKVNRWRDIWFSRATLIYGRS